MIPPCAPIPRQLKVERNIQTWRSKVTFLVTVRISVDEELIRLLKDGPEFVSAVRESGHDLNPSCVAAEEEGETVTFDSELVAQDLVGQIDQIIGEDVPTNNYDCGYLHALIMLYRLGRGFTHRIEGDGRTWAAERLISDVYVPPQSAERSRRQ
jgi:hypothetical protein